MSSPAESTDSSASIGERTRHESPASLTGRVPISLFMKDGTLTLAEGRLSYATKRRTVFDHPVDEFHSLAPSAAVGFHVWHGDRCYKFIPAYSPVHQLHSGSDAVNLAVNAARLGKAVEADRRMKGARSEWFDVLEPLIGRPPAGVKVRKPWPTWAIWASIVAVALVIMGVITAFALLSA